MRRQLDMLKLFTFVTITVFGIASCGEKSSDERISAAKDWLNQNQQEAATVELKNAIQKEPSNSLARFMLGNIYLNQGLSASAEKEFRVALDNGHDPNKVMPVLAKSLLMQFKNQELISLAQKSTDLSLEAATTLYTLQAQAYFQLGEKDKANKAIATANDLSADAPYSRLGMAYAAFNDKEIDIALETVDIILDKQPDMADAVLLKGQLINAKGRYEEALAYFKKYYRMYPGLMQAQIYLADSYIKAEKFDEAEKLVDQMLQLYGKSSFINQMKSQIRYARQDYEGAKHYAETAIDYGGHNQLTRTVAGVSAYQLQQPQQAYTHLRSIVDTLPPKHQLKSLFKVLSISLGYEEEGIGTDVDDLGSDNAGLLIQSGLVLARKGKFAQVKEIINSIDSSLISDPVELTRLSMLKLTLNDKSAIDDLLRVQQTAPENTEAKVTLAKAYLADGKPDKALELAEELMELEPTNKEGFNLAGLILASQGNFQAAGEKHLKSLKIDPNDITANVFFGKLAIKDKAYNEALKYYRLLVNLNPIYLPAVAHHFQLETLYGEASKAIEPIQNAYKADMQNKRYALLYAKLLETQNESKKALDVLKKIPVNASLPDAYWQLLVDLGLQLDDNEEVESTLIEWTSTNPSSGLSWRSLATYYENKGDIRKAMRQVQNGLQASDTEIDNLLILKAQYHMYLNEFKDAELLTKRLVENYGDENPVIHLLQGQLFAKNNQCAEATPALTSNYEYKPSTKVLKLILNCHLKLNQKQKAIQLTEEHISKFGHDNTAKLYLANLLSDSDTKRTEQLYKDVLETEELNRVALNNLVNLLSQKDQSDEAVKLAKAALNKSPNEPYLIEIYATALLANENTDEALAMYLKAYKASGQSKEYAQLYVEALEITNNKVMADKIRSEAKL